MISSLASVAATDSERRYRLQMKSLQDTSLLQKSIEGVDRIFKASGDFTLLAPGRLPGDYLILGPWTTFFDVYFSEALPF